MTSVLEAGTAVRFEWGATGAAESGGSCLVIVDVLSFTTAVSVAVEKGTAVFPYPWKDGSASVAAGEHDAVAAVDRRSVTAAHPWSLSPAALRKANPVPRLVLPSPNGSAIASEADPTITVVAACLRNVEAVGRWIIQQGFGAPNRAVTVVAAGERWPNGELRPALEDLVGAGALLSVLHDFGLPLSWGAMAAAGAYAGVTDTTQTIHGCRSGRELIHAGFGEDVAIAADRDTCTIVPTLHTGAFQHTP